MRYIIGYNVTYECEFSMIIDVILKMICKETNISQYILKLNSLYQ